MANCACDNVVLIPGLPLTTGIATDTLFEICNNPATVPVSQRMTAAQLVTFLTTAFSSLSVSGGKILLNADGSISWANGISELGSDGTASFLSGAVTIDMTGNLTAGTLQTFGGIINADGSVSFSGGRFTVDGSGNVNINGTNLLDSVGTVSFHSGDVLVDNSGNLVVPGATSDPVFKTDPNGILLGGFLGTPSGAYGINADGSAMFGTGGFVIDSVGNLSIGGAIQLNLDGSVSFASGGFAIDASGNISITGSVSGFVVMTANTTATATFNTSGRNETIYDTSGSLLVALTIALPGTSVAGQIVRYVNKSGVTTVTVTGTVSIGAALTTLAANSSVSWQAIDTGGSWIRIQ